MFGAASDDRRNPKARTVAMPANGAHKRIHHTHTYWGRLRGTAIKRVGFLLKVKRDRIEEYEAHHRAVWPEMLDALRRNGWRNYSLFMRDDGLMFGYFEADDNFAAALTGMSKEDVNLRWQDMMAPFFEIPPGAHPDEMMVELQEVFHTD